MEKPEKDKLLLVVCSEWCEEGFQVCQYDGEEFYYDNQPNDAFNSFVEAWYYIEELIG